MKRFFLLLLTGFMATVAAAQDLSAYQKNWFVQGADSLPYRLLLPKDYNPKTSYPLILMLHGAGERGSDNEAQLVHGSKLFLRDSIRTAYPAIVVFPQCAATSFWSNVQIRYDTVTKQRGFEFQANGTPTKAMALLLGLLPQLENQYKIDSKRRYVGGLSMGGMGTFEVVRRKPGYFVAAFPICGGANTSTATQLTKTDWWVFHGEVDSVVPVELSRQMADALKAAGAKARLTIYPAVNHNSWDNAFAEPSLMPWLFSNHK